MIEDDALGPAAIGTVAAVPMLTCMSVYLDHRCCGSWDVRRAAAAARMA